MAAQRLVRLFAVHVALQIPFLVLLRPCERVLRQHVIHQFRPFGDELGVLLIVERLLPLGQAGHMLRVLQQTQHLVSSVSDLVVFLLHRRHERFLVCRLSKQDQQLVVDEAQLVSFLDLLSSLAKLVTDL